MGGVLFRSRPRRRCGGGRGLCRCCPRRRGRGAVAIFGVAPAVDPAVELPRLRLGSGAGGFGSSSLQRDNFASRGWEAPVPVGGDSPGSPRCGARLCLRAAAERPPGAPGTRAGCAPDRAAAAVRPAEPGATAGSSRRCRESCGRRLDSTRVGEWVEGGRARGPHHAAPRPAPGRAAAGGSGAGGGGKIPNKEEGLRKTTNNTPFGADFDFTSVSRSRSRTPPPALPPLRGRGAVPAASGSLGAGERRSGSIPIPPRGNGAKFAVNLPLPFRAVERGASSPARPPGASGIRAAGRAEARTAAR